MQLDILEKNSTIALDCVLFEKCNLNCKHCFQNHIDNKIDLDYIKTLSNKLYTVLEKELTEKPYLKFIKFSMRGGELFQDNIKDEIINEYENIILNLKYLLSINFPNIKLTSHIMSNGIYKKIDRVITFLKNTDSKITLSYDEYGRYTNEKQKALFFKNYNIFVKNKLLVNIAITLTKPNMEAIITNKTLLKFNKNIDFDINYYIPTINKNILLPQDDDLYTFFKYLLDNNIFNFTYLKTILNNIIDNKNKVTKYCNCRNTIIFYKNQAHKSCNIYIPELNLQNFYNDKINQLNKNNGVSLITNIGLNKRKCLTCDLYNICTQDCWMYISYKDTLGNNCFHKRIHDYITKNKNIIDSYIKWINSNATNN